MEGLLSVPVIKIHAQLKLSFFFREKKSQLEEDSLQLHWQRRSYPLESQPEIRWKGRKSPQKTFDWTTKLRAQWSREKTRSAQLSLLSVWSTDCAPGGRVTVIYTHWSGEFHWRWVTFPSSVILKSLELCRSLLEFHPNKFLFKSGMLFGRHTNTYVV